MSNDFDPTAYGPTLSALIAPEPEMPLNAGSADRSRLAELSSLEDAWRSELARTDGVADLDAWRCCLAGVWLLHGFLDEAHAICQDVPTPAGSYWHGVMHRREGDFGNAQYWFRRAGTLPIGPAIASAAAASPVTAECLSGDSWDAVRFVDVVRVAVRQNGEAPAACRNVQRAEWRALFDWCWRSAVGR